MKIFDFLIKIALFWGPSVFLGWYASQITAENRVRWLYNQHVDLATELDFRHWLFGKNTLHIETSQIQGIPGFLDVQIPGFKDQEILRKRIELSNYDELIPNMSNLVKNRLHQETFRSSIWFLADSRYDGIFEFYIHNQISG